VNDFVLESLLLFSSFVFLHFHVNANAFDSSTQNNKPTKPTTTRNVHDNLWKLEQCRVEANELEGKIVILLIKITLKQLSQSCILNVDVDHNDSHFHFHFHSHSLTITVPYKNDNFNLIFSTSTFRFKDKKQFPLLFLSS
jgi:hypothetical protein